jgi:hypothetical protein
MRDELGVCGCEMKYPNIRDEICEIGEAGKGCSVVSLRGLRHWNGTRRGFAASLL